MKPVFLIAIVAVAMIGVMVPSAFADNVVITTVAESGSSQSCVDTGCYTPLTAVVNYGDTVTMTNTDPTGVHTFTSGTVNGFTPTPSGTFDSGVLMSGDSFQWQADVSGQVPYYCMLHTWMIGTIIVEASVPTTTATIITLDSIPSSIPLYDSISVSGMLTAIDGTPISGKPVWIEAESNSGLYNSVDTTTDSNGHFESVLSFQYDDDVGNWNVYAGFEGDSDYDFSMSTSRYITVEPPYVEPTEPPIPISLTLILDPIPSSVTEDEDILFSGVLMTSDGVTLITDAEIQIKIEQVTQADYLIGVLTTDENGEFAGLWSVALNPTNDAYVFYVVFEDVDFGTQSQRYSVNVTPQTVEPTVETTNITFTNPRIVDGFGNNAIPVLPDQQIQITADMINNNSFENPFTYAVKIKKQTDNLEISEAWITGSLSPGQSFTPALSWIPIQSGTYIAEISLYATVDDTIENKNKLAPSMTMQIIVGDGIIVPEPTPVTITSNFEVNTIRGPFDIGFSIKGGTVENMVLSNVFSSLFVYIDSKDNGVITLDLPREFIDSKKQDGTDDVFFVLVDDTEVYFEEITTTTDRNLTINFSLDSEQIEIIYGSPTPVPVSSSTNITLDFIYPISHGSTLITGSLTTADGTPLSGKSVWLQANPDTGNVKHVEIPITDSNGYFEREFFWQEDEGGNWDVFVYFEGDADYDSSVSASRYITVEPEDVLPDYPPTNYSADIIISQNTSVPGCEILNNCYSPYSLSVNVGDVIEWYNADSAVHTVTSGSPSDDYVGGEFDSGMLMSGESFYHTFENGGTFDYFDMLHPWNIGQILVQEREDVVAGLSITATAEEGGNIISISGENTSGLAVTLDVMAPNGNLVSIDHIFPDANGDFATDISVGGPLWLQDGAYKLTAVPRNSLPDSLELYVEVINGMTVETSTSGFSIVRNQPNDDLEGLNITGSALAGSDTLEITGYTSNINEDVTFTVTSPNGNLVSVTQVSPELNGDFTTNIFVELPLWSQNGAYTITAQQGNDSMFMESFEFEVTNGCVGTYVCAEVEITLSTDKSSYLEGETISISGEIKNIALGNQLSIAIQSPIGDIVALDQITVGSDKQFSTEIKLGGKLMEQEGTYTIIVTQDENNQVTTSFEFGGTTPVPSTSNTILTLDPLPPSIKTGESITFSGRLVTSDGVPISKQTILIKDDDSFGLDDLVAKAVTDSSGYYENTIIAKNWDASSGGASEIYAVFEGTNIYPGDRTLIYEINVKSDIKNTCYYCTTIIFDKLPKSILEGETVTFSGQLLTDERGIMPLEGKTIYIKQDVSLGSDSVFATLTTDENGYFTEEISFTLPRGTENLGAEFYAKWDGDSQNNSFRTQSQMIIIKASDPVKNTTVTLDPLPNKITEGESITFSGQLLTTDGIPLEGRTIYIKDDYDFDTDSIIKKTTTDSNGKFSISWSATVRYSGSYDFYAVFEGEEKAKRDRSLTYGVYVTAIQSFEPIRVFSDESIFEIGDSLVIYGDATPNEELQIALMDPNQNIITSKTIQVSSSGSYSTTLYNWKQSTAFGDYVVVAWSEIDQRYDGFWISFIEGVPQVSETKITLDRPPSSIVLNEPITFSGKLTTVDGSPIKNGHVIIATLTAQTPESLAEGYTDSSGRYSITWYAKQTSSSGLVPVYAYYGGNQFLDSTTSSLYDIKIEKPSLSVFTEKSTYDVGEQLLAYGYGNPNDRITVELKSAQGKVLNSEYSIVSSDGNYHTFFNLDNLSNGQYTIMVTSALYAISDSVSIQVESKIVTNEIDITGNIHYNYNKIPLEGIKAVLDIGAQQHIEYADSAGNFEFENIGFNPQLDYTLHFKMTDGKSFNFVDGEKFNADANINREANGEVISSKYLNLQLDNSKSTNHFSINLGDHLPYDYSKSSLITKGFDTQTKIVNFYSKVLNERPPIINIFLFGNSGAWYQSTEWDPSTNKVMSGYWQPRINVESSTNLMSSFGMEYTHYAQDYAYKKMNGYDTSPKEGNHHGFNNPNTADSWVEGVGSFMPAVIADWEHLSSAGTFSGTNLESNQYKPNSIYMKWGDYWLDEEYSIATLLWDMYDSENEQGDNTSMRINQVWKLIKGFDSFQQHNTSDYHGDKRNIKYFKDFYDYLYDESNMSGDNIDDLFISHGIPQGWSAAGRP